jgi:dihydrofolate reductase
MVLRVEGYAIVSADGMIADAAGHMPDSIKIDADQKFFHGALDHAAAVVHGRYSHEGGPRAALRRRLIVTRSTDRIVADSKRPHALLWNPAQTSFEDALAALGVSDGMVAIIGGTDVFGMFLPRYDAFHLTRAAKARIPGGRPVFPQVLADTPEDVLTSHGLVPGPPRVLDQTQEVMVTTWQRPP